MKHECAFIFISAGCDPDLNTALIACKRVNMCVTGVSSYDQACEVTKKMVARGVGSIELCAGFGNEGIARVQRAVGPDIAVGAVKFDFMAPAVPKSGDALFA